MDQPLGCAAGNRAEVAETIEALRGRGPADLMAVTLALAARMLRLSGRVPTDAEAVPILENCIRSGAAEARFRAMVEAQGGTPGFLDDPASIEAQAPCREAIASPADGWIAAVDAESVGRACLLLGAGRSKAGEPVDPDAGVYGLLKIGDPVRQGQVLARLTSGDKARLTTARPVIEAAYRFSAAPVPPSPVLLKDMGVNP
jgi:pyrimidine-nucleoside phosphorylase